MRSPGRRRPLDRSFAVPEGVELQHIAEIVRYVGSPEHKDMPSFAGQPRPRSDASICPRELSRDSERVEGWLKEAIRRGAVGGIWEGGFPRYA